MKKRVNPTKREKKGFHLERDEDHAAGLRRILREQAAQVLADLRQGNRDEAIHEARKSCKRARAVARLLRFTAANVYERENRVFRGWAGALSTLRDAQVRAEAFDRLVTLERDGAAHYAEIRRLLRDTNRPAATAVPKKKLSVLVRQARAELERLGRLKLPEGRGFQLLEKGLGRSYRLGREALAAAYDRREVTTFHEWRKRVKDLGYQMHLLRELWPAVLRRTEKELEELGDLLGRQHDLVIMRETVLKKSRRRISAALLQSFIGLLDRHDLELRAEARAIGRRIYAERPKAFLQRIKAYWKIWQSETAPAPHQNRGSLQPPAEVPQSVPGPDFGSSPDGEREGRGQGVVIGSGS